ncbi:MAG TPA: DUF6602 domain-containing protein [Candidatus Saccharimonadia bacterium]|jgi:hypothetical protein
MANVNRLSTAYFDSFAAEIQGKFHRLSHLVAHAGSNGTYHEEIVRTVLRNFLTKRYSVKTGFIYKDDQQVSRQMDIIIVDENSPSAYIFQEGDFAVVIPEAVVAFVEIKSRLTSQEFNGALKNIASAKFLFEYPTDVAGIIFGYLSGNAGTGLTDARAGSWFRSVVPADFGVGTNKFYGPDAMIWLQDNFSIMRYDIKRNAIGAGLDYRRLKSTDQQSGWQLSILLAMIVGACETREFKHSRQFAETQANRLLGMEVMDVSEEIFVFGQGVVAPPSE